MDGYGRGSLAPLRAAVIALGALLFLGTANASASGMAVQPDGKIVLGGASSGGYGALVRLEPDGSIDRGFGTDGAAVTAAPVQAVALQPDGKILAASTAGLFRFLPDGMPDRGFGVGGRVEFLTGQGLETQRLSLGTVSAVLVLADGRIAVGAQTPSSKYGPYGSALALLYAPDGKALGKFGEAGSPSGLTDMALQKDDSVVMVGWRGDLRGGLLARFLPGSAGPYDKDFSQERGLAPVFADVGESYAMPEAVSATPDGLLVSGRVGSELAVGRFDSDGVPDEGFGQGGWVGVKPEPPGDSAGWAVAAQSDGKIVVGGDLSSEGTADARGMLVARFLSGGALDPSFGEAGIARLRQPDGAVVLGIGRSLGLLPDGSALVAGNTTDGWNGFVIGRLLPNGSMDRSFGNSGVSTFYACDDGRIESVSATCIPRARVDLRVDQLARGRPSLRLHVGSGARWMAIRAVQLRLPRGLRFRRRHAALRAVFIDSLGDDQLRRPEVRARSLKSGPHRWDVGSMRIKIPVGILARARTLAPHRRLPFRITIWFAAKRHIPVRQDFVLWRGG